MSTYTITGADAIRVAARDGVTIRKHADPTEGARDGLTIEEAAEIAAQDQSLIFVTVELAGWAGDDTGLHVGDYFRDGKYLGPDPDGTEPIWKDA